MVAQHVSSITHTCCIRLITVCVQQEISAHAYHFVGLAGFAATISAAIRSVYCLSVTPRLKRWDDEIVPDPEDVPDWFLPLMEDLQTRTREARSKVCLGLGFDSYHMDRDEVLQLFDRARKIGVIKITSHWRRNNIAGLCASETHGN